MTYALKLTLRPAEISLRDVEDLRGAELSDRAIHDAASVVAYVNRMALGLGVQLET